MSRIVNIHTLKPGDRFSSIPAAWYGPGVVEQSYGNRFVQEPYSIFVSDKPVTKGTWTIKFLNNNVVNPPGVLHCNPDTKVRLLGQGLTAAMKRIKGRSY